MTSWNWFTLLAVAVVLVYLLFRRRGRHRSALIDPVCGMSISPTSAHATRFGASGPIYLCSSDCLAKFDAEPARYGGVTPHHGALVGC